MLQLFNEHVEFEYNALLVRPAGGAKPEAVVGKAMVGGPFELVDQEGRPFTEKNLLGSWALLYFGFTTCPDICPDELDKMTEALDLLGGYLQIFALRVSVPWVYRKQFWISRIITNKVNCLCTIVIFALY